MATIGIALSSEERGAKEIVDSAIAAEQAGFRTLWISDHYHPWNSTQGQSPFVWTTLGAIAQATELYLCTAVTCPTIRMHPAVVAQAAATTAALAEERSGSRRFAFGVGTGEALNEHIFGDAWPNADVRLEMLEESLEVIRELWTGETVDHRGKHYTVSNARLYTLPETTPLIYVSAFGPKAAEVAARTADGLMTVGPQTDVLSTYREHGGKGVSHNSVKVAYAATEEEGLDHAHRLWSNQGLPGELAQILPTPTHFEQASQLVTKESMRGSLACGPDPEKHIAAIQELVDGGFDEVYVGQIGPDQKGFYEMYAREVLPHFA